MKLFGFASLASLCALAVGSIVRATTSIIEHMVAFLHLVLEVAFPRPSAPVFAFAMAAAPRVIGLHEQRSFRARLAERWPASRQRTPVSAAYLPT